MPELPEVETVVRGLRRALANDRFGEVLHASMRVNRANRRGWKTAIAGKAILDVGRRGKYIIFHLANGHSVVGHLRMTGRLWVKEEPYKRGVHDRLIMRLASNRCLVLNDARQFARFDWRPPGALETHPGLAKLGPEAPEIGAEEFTVLCKNAHRPIKALLLDQSRLTGLGNIYADESLFQAGIRPTSNASAISRKRVLRLREAFQAVLQKAIEACGTTIDTFSDVEGSSGGFAPHLMVYRRTGEPCRVCHTPIRRIELAGRGTHYCSRCQRR